MADSSRSSNDERKGRLYNPYHDLHVPMQNLYNLPTAPEHLFIEEASKPHRSWGENLQYYTGCGYLSGAIVGGTKGSIEGLKAAEAGDTLKLRINRVLNSGGSVGRRYGNTVGILGLIFAGLESGVIQLRGQDDLLNTVVAGLGTGALYKAAAGPRSAAIAGAIGGIAAAAAVAGKQAVKRYVPI
ncbi:mitochondrial import inner membrane translocase subunit TIM23-2 [Humulus lupulus]|uniref:mitochondrial import inner membrane translocase subunit TIM23-2 n=1 Tax=Humulus lupulus TaxID=3486 RepID=UPI002B412CBC|nr:mitochondrial import inner membrane translocase subunit TIM23-2 [Humulus lupulus]